MNRDLASRFAVALFWLLSVSSLARQTNPVTAETPTFRSHTSMVLVPVIVTSSGRHVEGLKKSDFVLLDNGSPRPLASFEEVTSAKSRDVAPKLGPGVFTNSAASEQPQRVMILLLDLLNTPFQRQAFSREALIRFLLGRPDANEPVMVVAFTPDGLRVIHRFTSDPAQHVSALRAVKARFSNEDTDHTAALAQQAAEDATALSAARNKGKPDNEDVEQLTQVLASAAHYAAISRDQDRTFQTLYQFQQLARALAGVPGRKSLVWVTGGLSFSEYLPDPMAVQSRSHFSRGLEEKSGAAYQLNLEFERTWAVLSDAGIAMYPIDLAEVAVPSFTEAMYQSPHHAGSQILKSQAMMGLTENTGGSYCQLQATLENCFRDAMRDSAHYYLLSFYADPHAKPGWHKLQAKVPGKDVHLRSRGGYFQENAALPHEAIKNEVAQVLTSPLDATGILLAVRWTEPPAKDGGKAAFELFVDPNSISFDGDHLRLTVIVTSSEEGLQFASRSAKVVEARLTPEKIKKISAEGVLYRETVTLPKGTKAVRFVVRDETSGRLGTLTVTP